MSVKRDDSGRRFVEVEVEVPGTPEEVWRAIATGKGVSSWFVPSEIEEKVGGKAVLNFGPGMESLSTITEWNPPHRLGSDSKDLGPDAPTVATEWIVEAQSGGTCIVRVVHSIFADSDNWDNELGAWESGWPDFFRMLKLYLTHFPGQDGTLLQLSATTDLSAAEAWDKVCDSTGLAGAEPGQDHTLESVPTDPMQVHVLRIGESFHPQEAVFRMTAPTTGLAHWFTLPMGGKTIVSLRFHLFGDGAKEAKEQGEPLWNARIAELFPADQ